MDLVVFSVVLVLVIFAACGLAIWAVVGEERRTQASWNLDASITASPLPQAVAAPIMATPVVVTAMTMAHPPITAFVPAP